MTERIGGTPEEVAKLLDLQADLTSYYESSGSIVPPHVQEMDMVLQKPSTSSTQEDSTQS